MAKPNFMVSFPVHVYIQLGVKNRKAGARDVAQWS